MVVAPRWTDWREVRRLRREQALPTDGDTLLKLTHNPRLGSWASWWVFAPHRDQIQREWDDRAAREAHRNYSGCRGHGTGRVGERGSA